MIPGRFNINDKVRVLRSFKDVISGMKGEVAAVDYSMETVTFISEKHGNPVTVPHDILVVTEKWEEENLINHPKHYTSHPSGIECIEITRHMNFNDGNAIKYLWRAGLKDSPTDKDSLIQSIKDHKKSVWYLQDEIAELERKLAKQSSDGSSH